MKPHFVICFVLFGFLYSSGRANSPVDVVEKTFKIGINDESIFYGFAVGDRILFSLEVVKGKNIKEVEILEYPSSSKFMDYKTTQITNKEIKVTRTGVYEFRFKSGGLGGKVCKIKIQRIPASNETVNFNTSIRMETQYDTTYRHYTKTVVVGYDTTYQTRYRKELVEMDTSYVDLINRTERVHSQTYLDGTNQSRFVVDFPRNQISDLMTREVISWAYWIGVGQEGQAAYEKEKKKFLLESASKAASLANPLAGLAVGAYAIASNPPSGDNVKYAFTAYYKDGTTVNLGSGNSVVSYGKVTKLLQGSFSAVLENDNMMNGINVDVKMVAAVITKKYVNTPYEVPLVRPLTEEQEFKDPIVTSREVPILQE